MDLAFDGFVHSILFCDKLISWQSSAEIVITSRCWTPFLVLGPGMWKSKKDPGQVPDIDRLKS
jgi:hypothetical protein